MFHYINNFEDLATGKVVTSVSVRLLDPVSGDQIAIYADENGTPYTDANGTATNMATVNPKGRIDFWVSDGTYDFEVASATGAQIDYIRKINMVGDVSPEASQARDEAVAAAEQTDADAAQTALDAAATAADRVQTGLDRASAEAARDAALASGNIYPDEATGRVAVADGAYFLVAGDGTNSFDFLYRRVNSGSSTLISTYPSKTYIDAQVATVNGPLLSARINALMGTADTYDYISGLPATTTLAIAGNRAYVGSAIDAGTDIAVGAVIDSISPELLVDSVGTGTLAANIRVYVYSGNTADGGINTAPPNTPGSGGAWTLLETVNITPAAAGITPGNATRAAAIIPVTPIVVATGKTYAFIIDVRDGSDARLRLGYGYMDKTGDGRQRYYGWYHSSTAASTWTNHLATQKMAIRIGTKALTDVLDLQDYVSTITARQQVDEQSVEISTLRHVQMLNDNNLISMSVRYPQALDRDVTFWGDSLTQEAQVTSAGGDTSIQIAAEYVASGTITNQGVGGQTAAQIDTRAAAASAGTLAGYSFLWAGTNDLGSTTDNTATIKATMDTTMARFNAARSMVAGPRTGTVGSRNFGVVMKMRALLKASYGARAWSTYDRHPYVGSRSKVDDDSFAVGGLPLHLMVDSTHDGPAGPIGTSKDYARWMRTLQYGVPYVHSDVVGVKNGQAADSAIVTPRILGSPLDVLFWRQPAADTFRLNSTTGAITRGTAAITSDVQDVYLEARHKRGNHIGRITMVRQMDGTDPNLGGIRFGSTGQRALGTPGLSGLTDGKTCSFVICARLQPTAAGQFIAVNGMVAPNSGNTIRFIPRGTNGTTTLGTVTTPLADNPETYNMYFLSVDAANNLLYAATNAKTANTAAVTNADIGLSLIVALFTSTSAATSLMGVDLKMFWFSNQYIDWTNQANRDLFYNSSTLAPKDIGAAGTVSGITPIVYTRGYIGDYILGSNFGSGGDLYFPPYIDSTHLGVSTPTDRGTA